MLGSPIPEDLRDPDDHHNEKIRLEEQSFERGEGVPIHKADNHQLHIQEHERRQIERWQLRPESDRMRENQIRDQHLVEHVKTMQMAMQPAMPPAPPGGPGPTEPTLEQFSPPIPPKV
jgi:hypothetical protein